MTATTQERQYRCVQDDAPPETAARSAGPEAIGRPFTPAGRDPRGIGPAWNCREHVPGSIASWVAERRRFGGGRCRQEAAKAAYDAIWAGHGLGERGDEPSFAPGVITAIALAVTGRQQGSSDHATSANRLPAARRRGWATPRNRVRQP